jgi:hypothetical protein
MSNNSVKCIAVLLALARRVLPAWVRRHWIFASTDSVTSEIADIVVGQVGGLQLVEQIGGGGFVLDQALDHQGQPQLAQPVDLGLGFGPHPIIYCLPLRLPLWPRQLGNSKTECQQLCQHAQRRVL